MVVAQFSDYDELPKGPAESHAVHTLLYATCTHARHDKCCAKFGIPVACALRDAVGDRAWDCSHVGGDRFAGNVVIFPHGLYYGHVRPEDVPELVHTSERGDIWLTGYRGRCTQPRNVQIAEYYARRESGRLSIDEFEVTHAAPGCVHFRSRHDGSTHEVEFRAKPEPLREKLTCAAEESSPVPQYELVRYLAGK
jgi:hypothetical protein